MNVYMSLAGKSAIITGASSGIGKETAITFARAGCDVALCARDEKKLTAVVEEVSDEGQEIYSQVCDVRDEAQIKEFVKNAHENLPTGTIDILVNNAGIGVFNQITKMKINDLDSQLETNVRGAYIMIQEVLPYMEKQKWGIIFNVGSAIGKYGIPSGSAYCATKFALRGISQSVNAEYIGEETPLIRVTTVQPGTTDTPFHDPAAKMNRANLVPAEEIATMMLWAATRSDNCYIPELTMTESRPVFTE